MNNTGNGQGGNNNSPDDVSGQNQVIASNGRYVAFTSYASNLVPTDTNGNPDVFLRDLTNGITTRIDVSTSGVQANNNLGYGRNKLAISGTGRYVVFASAATNLIDGQIIATPQLYMRDTIANTTTLVSQKSDGTIASKASTDVGAVSDDGRFVLWSAPLDTNLVSTSETNNVSDYVYIGDLKTKTFLLLNHAATSDQYFVGGMSMSCDGALITFSTKEQLTSADTDSSYDIYLTDLRNGVVTTGLTTSSNSNGDNLRPTISCNGNYVSYRSKDTNLINSGTVPVDGNEHQYLYDRINNTTTLADTSTSGVVANAGIGTYSAVDNQGDTIFLSNGTNLIDGHTISNGQIYLKHRDSGELELLSKVPGGSAWSGSNGVQASVSITANGRTAIYPTGFVATTLLSSDTNGYYDIIASSTGL